MLPAFQLIGETQCGHSAYYGGQSLTTPDLIHYINTVNCIRPHIICQTFPVNNNRTEDTTRSLT